MFPIAAASIRVRLEAGGIKGNVIEHELVFLFQCGKLCSLLGLNDSRF